MNARLFEGRAARIHAVGDALRYRVARRDGTVAWREEHRDAAELAKIAEQLAGKKFLLAHAKWAPEHGGMLSRGATEYHQIGRVIGARVDGDHVVVEVLVDDEEGLAAIADGVHELSLGYICKLDSSGYQRDTEVDHLALVERGRCGGTCALRADESDERSDCGCEFEVPASSAVSLAVGQGGNCACVAKSLAVGHSTASHMPEDLQKQLADAQAEVAALTARVDAAEKTAAEQTKAREAAELRAHNAEKDLASRADADKDVATAEKSALIEKAAKAEQERDAEKARADALASEKQAEIDKVRADEAAVRQQMVDEKVELIAQVAPLGLEFKNDAGEPLSIHKIDARAIKLAAIKHVDGDDFTSKSNDWINGVFDSAMRRAKTGEGAVALKIAAQSRADAEKALAEVRETTNPNNTTKKVGYAAEKRAADEYAASLSSRWKNPSSN